MSMASNTLDDFDRFCQIANSPSHTQRNQSYNWPTWSVENAGDVGVDPKEEWRGDAGGSSFLSPDNMPGINKYRSRSVRESRQRRGTLLLGDDSDLLPNAGPRRLSNTSPHRIIPVPPPEKTDDGAQLIRVRSFKRTSKGVVSQGDLVRAARASRAANTESPNFLEPPDLGADNASGDGKGSSVSVNASGRTGRSRSVSPIPIPIASLCADTVGSKTSPYKVQVLGAIGVGKSTLCQQFITSEYLGARDSMNDEAEVRFLTVEVDEEESNLIFIDPAEEGEMSPQEVDFMENADAYMVIYAIDDHASFEYAERLLGELFGETKRSSALILVGNKSDLVRSRDVACDEGKNLAAVYDCKFMEVSTSLNHRVDDLLVGVISHIRHQQKKVEKEKCKLDKKHRDTGMRASLRLKSTKDMFSRFFKKHFTKSEDDALDTS